MMIRELPPQDHNLDRDAHQDRPLSPPAQNKKARPTGQGSSKPTVRAVGTMLIEEHKSDEPDVRPAPLDPAVSGRGKGSLVDNSIRHLHQIDVARRWCLSPKTLERWRWLRIGPRFMKIGGRVVYRIEDIESYETMRQPETAETVGVCGREVR
jgi:hypothetical protein